MPVPGTVHVREKSVKSSEHQEFDERGNQKVQCLECQKNGEQVYFHILVPHLKSAHSLTCEQYQAAHPGARVTSESMEKKLAALPVPVKVDPSLPPGIVKVVSGEPGKPLKEQFVIPGFAPAEPEAEAEPPAPAPEPPKEERRPKLLSVPTRRVTQVLRFGVAELPVLELPPHEVPLVPPIDEKYEVDMKFFEDLALAISRRENVLVVGPTGSGKTRGIEMLSALCNHPLIVVNMRSDFKSSAFVGQVHAVVDEEGRHLTKFIDGIVVRAMKGGYWLLIDEFDYCPSGILYTLQRVMSHFQLILDEDSGRVINAHPDFRLLATANTIGRGDDSGLYPGAQVLSEATLDRFPVTIQHKYLGTGKFGADLSNDDQEVVVVQRKSGVELDTVKKMVTVARLTRNGVEREECYCSFSTRRLLDWAGKSAALRGDWARAARTTFLNKMTDDDRKYVTAIIDRVLGKV